MEAGSKSSDFSSLATSPSPLPSVNNLRCATKNKKHRSQPHHLRASLISPNFLTKFRSSVLPFDGIRSRDQPHYLTTATRSPGLVWQWICSFLTGSLYNWIWCLQGARVALRITWRTGQTINLSWIHLFLFSASVFLRSSYSSILWSPFVCSDLNTHHSAFKKIHSHIPLSQWSIDPCFLFLKKKIISCFLCHLNR